MNKYITAITELDIEAVRNFLENVPRWIGWVEKTGKNALHYVCGVPVGGM